MSDALTKLAMRTLGLAPVARPLIAPLFAADPVPDAVPFEQAQIEQAKPDQAVPPQAALAGPPPDHAAVQPGRPAATAATALPVAAPEPQPELGQAAQTPAAHTPPAPARPTAAQTPAQPAQLPVAEEATLLPLPALPTTQPVRGSRQSGAAEHSAVTPRSGSPRPPTPGPAAPPVRVASAARSSPPEEGSLIAATATGARPETNPPTQPNAPQSDAQSPTIEITIGRVEVRALPAAPPTRPAAPASSKPQVSLEEYLRNQNRGRR